ncbi:MAG: hypothetical protein COB53_01780 [Elusimicrobia bacterium]|nr:MAG: hypothetical protein COB53_01780 [Elusimicrobiota bacterium]
MNSLLSLLAVFSLSAAEADLRVSAPPAGWSAQKSGVLVLRLKGPQAQKFQAARSNRTDASGLRKEAEGRWENYFISELISGDPVFIKKDSVDSRRLEGLLLCEGHRYELTGRIVRDGVLISLLGSLRCGAVAKTESTQPSLATSPPVFKVLETKKPRVRPRSYVISEWLRESSGESLFGKNREAVMVVRPYLRLRHYWNLGPMRIEELQVTIEEPIPGTLNYVFEGWGEPTLVRVIFEFKETPSEKLVQRIKSATSKNTGDAETLAKPYVLKDRDVDDGVLARLKRMGADFQAYAKTEKKNVDLETVRRLLLPPPSPDVFVWRGEKRNFWLGDGEIGMGTPGLRSVVFIRASYPLLLAASSAAFVLWLLVFWTPLLDHMPVFISNGMKTLMGAASTGIWVLYPLASLGWFFYEIHRAGYL